MQAVTPERGVSKMWCVNQVDTSDTYELAKLLTEAWQFPTVAIELAANAVDGTIASLQTATPVLQDRRSSPFAWNHHSKHSAKVFHQVIPIDSFTPSVLAQDRVCAKRATHEIPEFRGIVLHDAYLEPWFASERVFEVGEHATDHSGRSLMSRHGISARAQWLRAGVGEADGADVCHPVSNAALASAFTRVRRFLHRNGRSIQAQVDGRGHFWNGLRSTQNCLDAFSVLLGLGSERFRHAIECRP